MAFNPYATDYNVRSTLGMSPGQRLAQTLAGTTLKERGARRTATGQRFDISRALPKGLHGLNTGFAKRGLETSGLRNVGISDYLADVYRQQAGVGTALDEALFDVTAANLAAYDEYFGSRYGREFESAFDRAETAAKIREATG